MRIREEENRIESQILKYSNIEMPGRGRRRMKMSDGEGGE